MPLFFPTSLTSGGKMPKSCSVKISLMLKKILKSGTIPFLIMILLFVLVYLASQFIPEKSIKNIIETAGPFGPVVIVLGILLTNVIAPLGAAPFLFAGFLAYGTAVVFLAYLAAILASIINFWLAKKYGRKLVEKLAGKEPLEKVDSFTTRYGLVTLIFLRLFLAEQHDVISYAVGLTKIKFKPYFIISVLGMIPWTLLRYFLATKMHTAMDFTLLSVGLAWLVVLGIAVFGLVKKVFQKSHRR